ncbi:MAG: hypothetical protein WCJ35_22695 [Planctomycetota bacterium]
MKSVFYRVFTVAVELIAGLTAVVIIAILTLPDIFCIALLHAPRKILTILSLLAALSGFSAFIGCSKTPSPEPPRVVHWKGQDSGYEDETTVQPSDNVRSPDKH